MTGTRYCLDSSGFLDGFVRYYPPNIFASLWDRMDELCNESRLLVPEEVYQELEYHHDAAFRWIKDRRDALVVLTDANVANAVRDILADYPRLVMEGSTRDRADPFVIATAELHDAVVITGEKGGSESSPKIPFVCNGRGITCSGFLDLVQLEGWSF